MKQFVIDIEDENLIQVLSMYGTAELNGTVSKILIEHMEDLIEPVKDEIKEKYDIYSSLNKKVSPKKTR